MDTDHQWLLWRLLDAREYAQERGVLHRIERVYAEAITAATLERRPLFLQGFREIRREFGRRKNVRYFF